MTSTYFQGCCEKGLSANCKMLFTVILTNWTLLQSRAQLRPQDPLPGDHYPSGERCSLLSLSPSSFKSFSSPDPGERAGWVCEAGPGAGSCPQFGSERRRRGEPAPPWRCNPQRELLSEKSPGPRGPAAGSSLEAGSRGVAGPRSTIEAG